MPKSLDSFVWYNALDWGVLGGTAAILLGSGMLWHSALASLSDAAALFLH